MPSPESFTAFPMWATPHQFAAVPEADGERPRDLFTYGPIAEDVFVLSRTLAGKDALKALLMANRCLGLEWVTSIEGHSHNPAKPSSLRVFLEDSFALKPGYLHRPGNVFGERGDEVSPGLPAKALKEFASGVGPFAAQLFGRLKPYFEELAKAADGSRAMSPIDPSPLLEEMATAKFAQIPKAFRNTEGQTVGVGPVTQRLDHRVLQELLDLLLHKTAVARCPACKRVFVPSRRARTYCRRYFWDAVTHELVRGCVSDEKARRILSEAGGVSYRKEYLRLSKEIERLERTLGRDHPDVLAKRSVRDEWKATAGPRRGRPATPFPIPRAAKPIRRRVSD